MVENTQPLSEKENPEIALVVLNVSVDIKPFIEKCEVKVRVYKSIKQSYVSKHYHKREEKHSFIINS